jgi:hypothetical protein
MEGLFCSAKLCSVTFYIACQLTNSTLVKLILLKLGFYNTTQVYSQVHLRVKPMIGN